MYLWVNNLKRKRKEQKKIDKKGCKKRSEMELM